MKKLIALFALVLSTSAFAGYKQPYPVAVDHDTKFALGDMVSARYGEGRTFIGCGTRSRLDENGNTFDWGFCQAGTTEDDVAVCNTTNPAFIDAIRSLATQSFISFSWDEDNNCTYVGTSTQSFYLKLAKKKKK